MAAKLAFEPDVASAGVNIKAYHMDNGRFKDKWFMEYVEDNIKDTTYCWVGDHHQNGIMERAGG